MNQGRDIAGFGVPTGWFSRRLARGLLRFLHDAGQIVCRVPVKVDGGALVDEHEQFIVVSNHHSLVDTPVIFLALPALRRNSTATVGGLDFFVPRDGQPRRERFFRRMVIWFIRSSMNVLLIDRLSGEYSQIDRIDAMLGRGWNLMIFPEATRSRTGRMGRFRHGAAELARRHDLPVVPAYIDGTERILPPGVRWPRPGTLRVGFGNALRPGRDESLGEFTARLRDAVERLAPASEEVLVPVGIQSTGAAS